MRLGLPFDFSRIPVTTPPIQPKLAIDSPGDRFEREADDIADKVMRMAEPTPVGVVPAAIQRKCQACAEEEAEQAVPQPRAAAAQSIEGGEEEASALREDLDEPLQRKAESQSAGAIALRLVADRLARGRSSGEPLSTAPKQRMEAAFARDFSGVRVHRDGEAAELSRQLGARAFTHGSHIYFGSRMYDPDGAPGKRLLAHELAHVVQQGHAATGGMRKTPPLQTAVRTATAPAIQRAASWAAATVHEANSLADTALLGTDAGVTLPTFNGARGGALNAPTVNVAAVAAGGFDATVSAVPVNVLSVDETVLSAGPWRRVATKAAIRARFPSLTQCAGADNCGFRARGNPSDNAMQAANRRHEDHHGADGLAAFNASVLPWDTRLTAANAAGTAYHGASAAAAEAALFAAMGGTTVQARNAFVAAWNAAIPVYHGTPAGGPIGAPTDPTAAPDCSWAFARYTNPS